MSESSWDQEILRILGEQTIRGVLTLSIKEILKEIKNSQVKNRVIDFLKTRHISDFKDIHVVDLRSNSKLYTLLQNEIYKKYVRVDEGNGLVFLDRSADPLVNTYKGDIDLDDFAFIKSILEQISKGYAFGKFIEISKKLKPPNQDPQKWTGDIVKQGEEFSIRFKDLNSRITELLEFRVKVRDFQNTVDRIIKDYSNLMRDMIGFCLKVIKESNDRTILDQGIFVFSLYDYGVMSVYKLSVKWHIDVEPPFIHTADFISIIVSFSDKKDSAKVHQASSS